MIIYSHVIPPDFVKYIKMINYIKTIGIINIWAIGSIAGVRGVPPHELSQIYDNAICVLNVHD